MDKIVNIIGAGLSGLAAAINLAKNNIKCNLISNMPSERAQSVLAEGGINACLNTMGENDTILEHFNDTKKGGVSLENDENITNLVNNAPKIIEELIKLGVPFNYENGHIIQRNFGGQKKKRTAFAKSSTGKMIMTALIDEARKYEAKGLITRYMHHECVDANIINNKLESIIIKDLFANKFYKLTGITILAIGGLNGFFDGYVTGSNLNNSNLPSKLFLKGLEFKNLEFIQYHPTTIDIGYKRLLVSEAARGEGGRLLVYKDGNPYYFMEDLHPLGNLAPRDVISKQEYLILNDPTYDNTIYLDLRELNNDIWKNKLSDLRDEIIEYIHLDPKNDLIPVSPGIHFFMGGINVDINHKTNIDRLYAVGEASSIYHGANRLGGNSMLGALCGGIIASNNILSNDNYDEFKIEETSYDDIKLNIEKDNILRDILINTLSIIRNNNSLNEGLIKIEEIINNNDLNSLNKAKYILGMAMIKSALERKESRGAHQRSDFPNLDDNYLKSTIAKYADNKIIIEYRGI